MTDASKTSRHASQPSPPGDDFYRKLLEHAAVAMIATDADFHILCLNPLAQQLLGAGEENLVGRPIEQVVPPERRKLMARLLARTTDRNETSRFDIRLELPGQEPRDLLVVLSPIPSHAGPAQGVAAWIIDQTGRVRLNDRLAQAEKMASLGTLAAGVAHHFNNILGGVTTFVDFALTGGDISAMRRALRMTAEAAARASKITQSLLSFAAKDPHRSDMADLTEVILTFAHLVERPLAEKNIKVHLDLHPVPVFAVEANRMHQVLGNLLTNAEEAMPDGGTITLRLSRQDDHILLEFADTGCGIDPRHLPLVFEPFFTTKGLLSGGDKANPGLGLSVVHGIITEMRGAISVESQPGQWTRFTVSFPIPEAKR